MFGITVRKIETLGQRAGVLWNGRQGTEEG